MKEQLISFDTAKLAKEKGLQIGTRKSYIHHLKDYFYDDDPTHRESYLADTIRLDYDFYMVNGEEDYGDFSNENYTMYEAPTQSMVQKWLRDKHNIHIQINLEVLKHPYFSSEVIVITSEHYHSICTSNPYPTYEEALEEGLQEALNLIIK